MRKSRFTEEQIVAILKEGEAGVPVAELLRRHGISRATYFLWRSKYAGTTVSEPVYAAPDSGRRWVGIGR